MEYELAQLTSQIKPLDKAWLARAQERLDSLTKPQGSLGRLEELAARYVAIRQELLPDLERKWVVVFAADHGVVAEGGERLSPGRHLPDGLQFPPGRRRHQCPGPPGPGPGGSGGHRGQP